ncbi:high mobility group nucleosome-binding domain-containing protein 5-like [Drosophila suzukii]|uniref:High mobility group nucleosome-binding domain-containing protein 5-like n=1 Tax=Drosophila suzukii TaxID=28584 RepID=A0ABM4TYZ1_DROSZ
MARQKGDKDGKNSKGEDSGFENFEDDGGTTQKEGGYKSNSKGRDKSNGKDGGIQSFNEEDGDKSNGQDGGIQSYDEEDGETNGKDAEGNDKVAGSILRIRGKRNKNYTEDDMHNQAGENSRNAKSSERKIAMPKGIGRTSAGSRSGRNDRAMRAVRGDILLRNA